MQDLSTLANLAEILSALTIIGGAGFAVVQLREYREQRRQAITVELVRSFHNPAFANSVSLLRTLPDGVSAEDLRARGPEYESAAIQITTTYETIGFLVFRELTSFFMVRELSGGISGVMYRKLSPWLVSVREEQAQPSFGEWFQWLAEQLIRESDSKEANPAHMRFASWRPRK